MVNFHFKIPTDCWENCKKIKGYFFAATCKDDKWMIHDLLEILVIESLSHFEFFANR